MVNKLMQCCQSKTGEIMVMPWGLVFFFFFFFITRVQDAPMARQGLGVELTPDLLP